MRPVLRYERTTTGTHSRTMLELFVKILYGCGGLLTITMTVEQDTRWLATAYVVTKRRMHYLCGDQPWLFKASRGYGP